MTESIDIRLNYGSVVEKTRSRKTLDLQGKQGSFGGGADQDQTGDLLNAIYTAPEGTRIEAFFLQLLENR